MSPETSLRTLANFQLEATFKKLGMDALRFEFRYKGGNWQTAAVLLSSPGTFAVAPQTPKRGPADRSPRVLYPKERRRRQPLRRQARIHRPVGEQREGGILAAFFLYLLIWRLW
jgi:hypothetical protein